VLTFFFSPCILCGFHLMACLAQHAFCPFITTRPIIRARTFAALALPSHPRTFFVEISQANNIHCSQALLLLSLPCLVILELSSSTGNHTSAAFLGHTPAFLALPSHPRTFIINW
jgi:hypothetical protein